MSNRLAAEYYLVAFLDVLGQRAKIRKWKDLPENEREREVFISNLKETAGVVLGFRRVFQDFLQGLQTQSERSSSYSPEMRSVMNELIKHKIIIKTISDSMIIAV